MQFILGAVAVVACIYAGVYLHDLWGEWIGAVARWRKGQPLRLSDLLSKERKAASEKREARKLEMRLMYEVNPALILNFEFATEFRVLDIHKDIRSEVISRCGNKCGACGITIRRSRKLHVDHIKPMKLFPQLKFKLSNLQVLCVTCNVHKSAYHGDDWKEVTAARRKLTQKVKAQARRDVSAMQHKRGFQCSPTTSTPPPP
jgi:hypothetical protein